MNTSAWARLSDSAAIDGKLMQHIQMVTYLEFDVSPIPSPKNNLKVLLRRVGHCRLPIKLSLNLTVLRPILTVPVNIKTELQLIFDYEMMDGLAA
jgi:hypothetical protein